MYPDRLPKVRPGLRADLLWGAATALLALLVGMWALDAWGHVRTDVPAYYGGSVPSPFAFDIDFTVLVVQALAETGNYQTHDRLGAPFGLELYDFPLGTENVQWLLMSVISIVADTPGAIMNSYLVLTFPLVAGTAFAGFRVLGASRGTSLVVAVLFAALPYHFLRGEYHLFLANYMAVPLGCVLVVAVLRGDAVFRRGERSRRFVGRWLTLRTVGILAVCAVVGASGNYYLALTVMLLGLGGLVAAAVHRRPGPLVTAAVLCVAILASTVANLSPSLAYWQENGRNPVTAVRAPADAEAFSLKFTQLVLPSSLHRIDGLSDFGGRYSRAQTLADEGTATLGLVATVGLLFLLGCTLIAVGGRRLRLPLADTHRAAAVAAVLAFAIGTTGGLSALISYYVSPQVRAYNRVSVFIAFFALLAVALLLDAGANRLRARGVRKPVLGLAAGLVLVLGILDQTSPKMAPDYTKAQEAWASVEAFGREAEDLLPAGAWVFQMPIRPFPEFYGPYISAYDNAQGALHTRTLRWSFAAMKGRPEYEWQAKLTVTAPRATVRAVTAAGFSALYFDRQGFDPAAVAGIEAEIARTVGRGPAVIGRNGRLALFDLRPYAGRLRRTLGSVAFARLGRTTLQVPPPPAAG